MNPMRKRSLWSLVISAALLSLSCNLLTAGSAPPATPTPTLVPAGGGPAPTSVPPEGELCTDYALDVSYQQTTSIEDVQMEVRYEGRIPLKADSPQPPASLHGEASLPVTGNGHASDCSLVTSGSMDYVLSGQLALDEEGKPVLQLHADLTASIQVSSPNCGAFGGTPLPVPESFDFTMPYEDGYVYEWPLNQPYTEGTASWTLDILCEE